MYLCKVNCIFTLCMSKKITDNSIFEYEPFEEDGYVLMVAETSWRGMADELQELHNLKGAQFINQLKMIVYYGDFHPVEGETSIFSAISEQSEDFDNVCIYCLIRKESERQILSSSARAFIRCLTLSLSWGKTLLATDLWNLLGKPIMYY